MHQSGWIEYACKEFVQPTIGLIVFKTPVHSWHFIPNKMDHIVYLDYKAKELDNLISGQKTMIIRGAMGRKMPHGRIEPNDTLYFMQNNGSGMVIAKANAHAIFCSGQLTKEESKELVDSFADKLMLNTDLRRRFRGKRYLTLITLSDFKTIEPFCINREGFGNVDDWLPVGNIESARFDKPLIP